MEDDVARPAAPSVEADGAARARCRRRTAGSLYSTRISSACSAAAARRPGPPRPRPGRRARRKSVLAQVALGAMPAPNSAARVSLVIGRSNCTSTWRAGRCASSKRRAVAREPLGARGAHVTGAPGIAQGSGPRAGVWLSPATRVARGEERWICSSLSRMGSCRHDFYRPRKQGLRAIPERSWFKARNGRSEPGSSSRAFPDMALRVAACRPRFPGMMAALLIVPDCAARGAQANFATRFPCTSTRLSRSFVLFSLTLASCRSASASARAAHPPTPGSGLCSPITDLSAEPAQDSTASRTAAGSTEPGAVRRGVLFHEVDKRVTSWCSGVEQVAEKPATSCTRARGLLLQRDGRAGDRETGRRAARGRATASSRSPMCSALPARAPARGRDVEPVRHRLERRPHRREHEPALHGQDGMGPPRRTLPARRRPIGRAAQAQASTWPACSDCWASPRRGRGPRGGGARARDGAGARLLRRARLPRSAEGC